MRIGLSTYSLLPRINAGRMGPVEAIDWIAANGGQHVEIVPFGFLLRDDATGSVDTALIDAIAARAKDAGVPIACYSILANLCPDGPDFEGEIARIQAHVDVAARLGAPMMRHDISSFRRPIESTTMTQYVKELPRMIEGAQRIADYAKERGVATLLENHGFFVNGSDRVLQLLSQVDRDNYRLLMDTGNFLCVDEPAEPAAAKLASHAAYVHLKDFYIRSQDPGDAAQFDCAGSWFRSVTGRYLRGSILAQGDLDIPYILGRLKAAGFDGDLTIEFEGMEDCEYASRVSMDNARRIWNALP